MNRQSYYLFGYDRYYPSGGMHDHLGNFDTIDKAKEKAGAVYCDYYEIVTLRNNELMVIEDGEGIYGGGGEHSVTWEGIDE